MPLGHGNLKISRLWTFNKTLEAILLPPDKKVEDVGYLRKMGKLLCYLYRRKTKTARLRAAVGFKTESYLPQDRWTATEQSFVETGIQLKYAKSEDPNAYNKTKPLLLAFQKAFAAGVLSRFVGPFENVEVISFWVTSCKLTKASIGRYPPKTKEQSVFREVKKTWAKGMRGWVVRFVYNDQNMQNT